MKTSLALFCAIATSLLTCGSSDLPEARPRKLISAVTTVCAVACPDKAPTPAAPAQPAPKQDSNKAKREPRPARPEFLFL